MMRRFAFVAVLLVAAGGPLSAQNWNHDWNRDRSWHNDDRYNDRRDDNRDYNRDRGNNGDNNRDVTDVQKRACRPDVFRLCSWYIPNRDAITACLHNNMDRLNGDCRAVMEGRLK